MQDNKWPCSAARIGRVGYYAVTQALSRVLLRQCYHRTDGSLGRSFARLLSEIEEVETSVRNAPK